MKILASRRFSTKTKGTSKYNGTVRSCCHHLWNSLGSGPLMFSSLVMLGGQSTALDESLWISPWIVSEIIDTNIRRIFFKNPINIYIHIDTFPHVTHYITNTDIYVHKSYKYIHINIFPHVPLHSPNSDKYVHNKRLRKVTYHISPLQC